MPGVTKGRETIKTTPRTRVKSLITARKNIKQITEEEYDAWIEIVTDSIDSRVSKGNSTGQSLSPDLAVVNNGTERMQKTGSWSQDSQWNGAYANDRYPHG